MLYEKSKGEQLGSEFLIADAKHTKSDILVSLTVIASLVFHDWVSLCRCHSRSHYHLFYRTDRLRDLKDASTVLVDTVCLNTRAVSP